MVPPTPPCAELPSTGRERPRARNELQPRRSGLRIAIFTPAYNLVTGEYAVSLANMINWTLTEAEIVVQDRKIVPTLKVFMRHGSLLPCVRNALVKDALDFEADYLLWLDADHHFPENSLLRLLRHNLPVIACNQQKRSAEHTSELQSRQYLVCRLLLEKKRR